ncbi:MAG: 23S rRNA (adenine(2503)-C(2))-methyltransferase [Acidobacteriales bacterium 13_2_20CM_2_55_5]|jgi:23S rRNA (adenine2503-C2)-methyltransferase|nr:MAG: 23S rRNA (adenine(2503)-C(2))-methyltransferase [Acidobacteriales bacterium 13_2_20CM_2_55_5]
MMTNTKQQNILLGLGLHELTLLVEESGQPQYRAQQLFEAIYRQRVGSAEQISTLSQECRAALVQKGFSVGLPTTDKKFVSVDGTVRYLVTFADGESVETVWMPEGDAGEAGDGSEAGNELEKQTSRTWDRATICVSSQVGCAVDCKFCLTGLLGVKRNLTAGEIVGQIAAVLNEQHVAPPRDRVNLVFMGMGEPFLNYDNFIKAVRLLVEGVGIPESRMTVSTAGIVPRIYDLGAESIRPKLAISLNAPNDDLRTRLMPINRKWNLEKLMAAARDFPLRNRERLTFEYVLLDEVNDFEQNARELVELIRGVRAKVNLIALNPGPGIPFLTPAQDRVARFQNILIDSGVPTFIRRPRGRDIYAACGQLKRTLEMSA